MPVEQTDGRLVLIHSKGASAELLLYGATVISWKVGTQTHPIPVERLFLSSKAALDGSKPVRGGIPIVFPCFGVPSHPEHTRLGQHGFARSQVWTFDGVVRDDLSGVAVRLTLGPTPAIRAIYDRPFELAYVVTLGEDQLSTDLHVTHTSTSGVYPPDTLAFQALFHNYIRAPANQVLIFPLQNKTYYDKTETRGQGYAVKTETRVGVDVRKQTDAVYEDASPTYEVVWPGGGVEMVVSGLKDVVVWNPGSAGHTLLDMEDGGWERFVCVEPGHVSGFLALGPGQTWVGQQRVSVVDA